MKKKAYRIGNVTVFHWMNHISIQRISSGIVNEVQIDYDQLEDLIYIISAINMERKNLKP